VTLPDSFLDSPESTIPHEAAYAIRLWLLLLALAYVGVVAAVRVLWRK
jgi:hypothetical protein